MKILITGGAGYKGIVLADRLLKQGHHVTIFDNFVYGFGPVLYLVNNPNLEIVRGDIRNISSETVKGCDAVFHLAGLSGYPACEANPHSAQIINVDASERLGSLLSPSQPLIYASTTSFYGASGKVCDEETPVDPVSLYGATKHKAEQILMQRENTVSLRFATIFGVSPKMRIDLMVNDFTFRAVNDRCIVLFESKAKRTFLHLQDAIDAYVFTLSRFGDMKGQIYNVGDQSLNYSKGEIAEHIKATTGCAIIHSAISDLDPRHFLIAFDKLAKLDYRPKRTLDEGISELTKLYKFYNPISTYATI